MLPVGAARTVFDADAAEAILRRACAVADVDPDGSEVLDGPEDR
jgi:tellurite resistance protein